MVAPRSSNYPLRGDRRATYNHWRAHSWRACQNYEQLLNLLISVYTFKWNSLLFACDFMWYDVRSNGGHNGDFLLESVWIKLWAECETIISIDFCMHYLCINDHSEAAWMSAEPIFVWGWRVWLHVFYTLVSMITYTVSNRWNTGMYMHIVEESCCTGPTANH